MVDATAPTLALQASPLHDRHDACGATFAPFAGWNMPLHYGSAVAEHKAVVGGAGVFDVSHMGTVLVSGPRALDVLLWAFTNDASKVKVGKAQYTLCANEQGGVDDDVLIYRVADHSYMVVPNASNVDTVVKVLRSAPEQAGAAIDDVTHDHAILAVQGPKATSVLGPLVGNVLSDMPFLGVERMRSGGWICRSGYTGAPGAELIVPVAAAEDWWNELIGAGAQPCGLGARDSLRLEMGYPLHGHELTPDIDPFTSGAGFAVKLDRDDFRGRDALVTAKARDRQFQTLGIVSSERRPLRDGLTVMAGDIEVGATTSGGWSPVREVGMAIARVATHLSAGDEVAVDVRGKHIRGTLHDFPMVDRNPR